MLPPSEPRTTSGDVESAGSARKPWRTPHVILATMAEAEAKGPPTAEQSLFFSKSTNTGNS